MRCSSRSRSTTRHMAMAAMSRARQATASGPSTGVPPSLVRVAGLVPDSGGPGKGEGEPRGEDADQPPAAAADQEPGPPGHQAARSTDDGTAGTYTSTRS